MSSSSRLRTTGNVECAETRHVLDYLSEQARGLDALRPFAEIKTTRHPVGR